MADLRLVLSSCAGGFFVAWLLLLGPRPPTSPQVRGAALAGQAAADKDLPESDLYALAKALVPEPKGVVHLEQSVRLSETLVGEDGLEGALELWLGSGGALHMQWRFPEGCADDCLHQGQSSQALVHASLEGGAQAWLLQLGRSDAQHQQQVVERVESVRAELKAGVEELGLDRHELGEVSCLTQWLGQSSVCVVPEWSVAMAIEAPGFSLVTTDIELDAEMPDAFASATIEANGLPKGDAAQNLATLLSASMVSRAQLILLGQLSAPEKQASLPEAQRAGRH